MAKLVNRKTKVFHSVFVDCLNSVPNFISLRMNWNIAIMYRGVLQNISTDEQCKQCT